MIFTDVYGNWGSDYATWCGQMAAKFGGWGIHYYELGNEVNLGQNWFGNGNISNVVTYGTSVKQAYTLIKVQR
jgi:hypothetical protein